MRNYICNYCMSIILGNFLVGETRRIITVIECCRWRLTVGLDLGVMRRIVGLLIFFCFSIFTSILHIR